MPLLPLDRKIMNLALGLIVAAGMAGCDDNGTTEPDPLLAPTGVSVAESSGGDALVVTWNTVTGAESYSVQRQVEGEATFSDLATGLTEGPYTDETVVPATTYLYRVASVRGTETSNSDPVIGELGLRLAEVSGAITGTRTFFADTTYILKGIVTVDSGGVLTVEPGTLILGDVNVSPTALIVRRGGRIEADGTASEPIVFTSSAPEGQRATGDWGGLVLNGFSICNFPADECVGEGTSGQYGGDILDDNSGTLRYVRVEYGGFEVSFGNELNGITLNGVGSGTTIEYVQSHFGQDDGVEWFGGTVNARYLVVTGANDDSFDYSTGWQGSGQFWIVQQDPANGADNGFEVDNNEDDYSATPLTSPTLYNITMVGADDTDEGDTGLLMRRGTGGEVRNIIVMGFSDGLDIDNDETYAQCASGGLIIDYAIYHDNGNYLNGDADDETACTGLAAWANVTQGDPLLGDPYNFASPDWVPATGGPADSGATPPDNGFFDTSATYIGAVEPGTSSPWYAGWITTARN